MGSLVAIQLQVPLEVGFTLRHNLGNEFADQIRAGGGLAQVQYLLQCRLNFAPFRLIPLDDGVVCLGVVFRLQLLQFLMVERYSYKDISVQLMNGSSDGGAEKAYNAAIARFTAQLIEDHVIRVVDMQLKK